jgi:hypothetical protein
MRVMSPPRVGDADRARAGRSAEAIYRQRYRRWRARTRVAVLLAIVPVPAIMLVCSIVWPGFRTFDLGAAVGVTTTLPFVLTLVPPEHIDRWRRGAEAERRTAKALRRLSAAG